MGSLYLLVGVIGLSFLHDFGVKGTCPRRASEAEARAKQCLQSVGLSMEPTSGSRGQAGDPDRLQQYCQNGTLEEAVMCVENIVNECQRENPNVGETLAKAVSIDKPRSGFHYLCKHIDILRENSDCISQQTQPISKCINIETKKFQAEIRSYQRKNQQKSEEIWTMSCSFMERVFECQETGFRENCGDDVADVLANFMQSVKPPICAELNFAKRSAPTGYLYIILALVTVLYSRQV